MPSPCRRDNADLLNAAQTEVDRLRAQLEQACAERDAALIEARTARNELRAAAVNAPGRQSGSVSLHVALAVGIECGLRDMGADLSGCTPSMLTGHVIRELRAAHLVAGSEAAASGRGEVA